MYPVILIRILKSPERIMTIDQNEATPPEDLKRSKRSPQRTYWGVWGNWKENNQFLEKKEGMPRCRKEIEADGISAHENQQDGCTSSILVNK